MNLRIKQSPEPVLEVGYITTAHIENSWDKQAVLEKAVVRIITAQDRCGMTYCIETVDSGIVGMATLTSDEDREDGVTAELICNASVRITDPASLQERQAASRMFGFDTAAYYRNEAAEIERFLESMTYYFGAAIAEEFRANIKRNVMDISPATEAIIEENSEQFMEILKSFRIFKDMSRINELIGETTAVKAA